jgi:hypothetical protein
VRLFTVIPRALRSFASSRASCSIAPFIPTSESDWIAAARVSDVEKKMMRSNVSTPSAYTHLRLGSKISTCGEQRRHASQGRAVLHIPSNCASKNASSTSASARDPRVEYMSERRKRRIKQRAAARDGGHVRVHGINRRSCARSVQRAGERLCGGRASDVVDDDVRAVSCELGVFRECREERGGG